ncbi:MAG: amidohydrolase family protein, partial [Chitinispirillaceae bacterium]|nr:amidohydrolase family protein [Chitinispirillaceae bacterium]
TTSETLKIPPFMDAHVHFVIDGKVIATQEILNIIEKLKSCGIFSVYEMGYKTGIGLEAKKIISEKLADAPIEIKVSGFAVYKKGSYGVFLGKPISNRREIKKVIEEITKSGIDFLKVVNSGIVCTKGEGTITPGGFSFGELEIICKEAQERGLPVVCHANGDKAIKEAVLAGASSIEHGFFISKESIQLMAEKKVSWTPTTYALLSFGEILPSYQKKYIEEIIDKHLEAINYASSIGVQLRVGTDSGSKGVQHGQSIFCELSFFKKAGLSLEKILSYACMDGGEIEKGNYLIVRRDFIEARRIEGIFYKHNQIY